jgi:hypothetical protein
MRVPAATPSFGNCDSGSLPVSDRIQEALIRFQHSRPPRSSLVVRAHGLEPWGRRCNSSHPDQFYADVSFLHDVVPGTIVACIVVVAGYLYSLG